MNIEFLASVEFFCDPNFNLSYIPTRLYKLEIDGEEYIVNDKGGITPHKPKLDRKEDLSKKPSCK